MPPLVPEFYVSDLEVSLPFYRDILGFEVVYSRAEDRFVYIRREGADLMLEEPRSDGRTFLAGRLMKPYGVGMHLQIGVSDAASLHADCVAAGLEIHLPLEERWYRRDDDEAGQLQFLIADPDGYLLRFAQDISSSHKAAS